MLVKWALVYKPLIRLTELIRVLVNFYVIEVADFEFERNFCDYAIISEFLFIYYNTFRQY